MRVARADLGSEPWRIRSSSSTPEIHEGKLEELRRGVAELAAFVEENEADPISYEIFFSDDGRLMTVVQGTLDRFDRTSTQHILNSIRIEEA